ncbi:MAG: type II toxin-antitoxin system ParD family antitoxin [Methylococcales bacterium]|nr:type II toxin-antitoxin system ParD family antitoxin [Methylococcales bacterium]MBT7445417.1 type II toxin-antitoxin system ParD family antitoxin [Methylococcales bacterium]
MVKKSITVTDQQENWIQAQMATGQYATDSELIREALREKELRTAEIDYIRAKLIAAEQSVERNGWVDKTQDEILADIKEKARVDGKL